VQSRDYKRGLLDRAKSGFVYAARSRVPPFWPAYANAVAG
jgi:hypothetical protein